MGVCYCPPSLRWDRAAAGRLHAWSCVVVVAVSMTTTLATRPETGEAAAQVDTATAGLAAFGPTGPDVLVVAAHILPAVSNRLPLAGDVHLVLVEALVRLGAGADRHHRLRLADDARDMLAAYLVTAGLTRPEAGSSATVRGWVVFQDLASVRRALAGAAWFWHAELAAALSTPEGE